MSSKKYTYHIKKVVLALLCLTTFASCQFHELTEECDKKGLIIVNLGLEGLSTRAAGPLFTGDDQIDKIRIFVFHGNVLEVNKKFSYEDNEFVNPFVLEVTTGLKDIFIVANEGSTLGLDLESVSSITELTSVLADNISESLNTPLVMTGIANDVLVDDLAPGVHNNINITLTRISSKITLQLNKVNPNTEIKITKISLLSNTTKTTLFEPPLAPEVTSQSFWDYQYIPSNPLELTTNFVIIDNIYLYENITGGIKTNATQFEIEALYNGIPTKYRVFINENITSPGSGNAGDPNSSVTDPSDHLYSIIRNHHYRLNGTIIGIGEFDGLTLTTDVLPWNLLPSVISFERKFTINPIPTLSNHTYTVDSNGEVKFTFKLTSPIDASWVANLTLLGQFMFVGANQGITDEEVEITIKAINPPGDEEQTTEFYINVGYGGNWSEIPLLSGSDLIGVGNRVIIRQPANQ